MKMRETLFRGMDSAMTEFIKRPKCFKCGLELDDEETWYNSDFSPCEDETTKWKCPNEDCDAINLTTGDIVPVFLTEEFDEKIHDDPDSSWDGKVSYI